MNILDLNDADFFAVIDARSTAQLMRLDDGTFDAIVKDCTLRLGGAQAALEQERAWLAEHGRPSD